MVIWSSSAYVFGGWDKIKRHGDVYRLCLKSWHWELLQCGSADQEERPPGTTDHSAVLWEPSAGAGCEPQMVVFGGSSSGGPTNSTWLLSLKSHRWSLARTHGAPPCPRTAHAALCSGDRMLVTGGEVTGHTSQLADCHILDLTSMTWTALDPLPAPVCRHSMALLRSGAGARIAAWGGYSGTRETHRLLAADSGSPAHASEPAPAESPAAKQESWDSRPALRASDLGAEASGLSGALLAKRLHHRAVEMGYDTYIDPATGYSVFTSLYLKRRPCCGNRCRHCPHGHVNVPKAAAADW